jgi:hypothetical protein
LTYVTGRLDVILALAPTPWVELELDGCCFLVELAQVTKVEKGREDLEDPGRMVVERTWEMRCEIAGEGGAWSEEGVFSGLVVLLLVGSEK